jgi:hypothetical protein
VQLRERLRKTLIVVAAGAIQGARRAKQIALGARARSGGHRDNQMHAHLAGEDPPEAPGRVDAEWSETHGTVRFDWGQCTMQAAPDTLLLRAESAEEEGLRRIRDIIARDIER